MSAERCLPGMRQDHLAGCGQHVGQAIAGVPASGRYAGRASDPAARGGWLRRPFGRG